MKTNPNPFPQFLPYVRPLSPLFHILLGVFLVGCNLSPVQLSYDSKRNHTTLTTKPLELKGSKYSNKLVQLQASMGCRGRRFCSPSALLVTVTYKGSFGYLKNRPIVFSVGGESRTYSSNLRYTSSYDTRKIARDGTSGVLQEQVSFPIKRDFFKRVALETDVFMEIAGNRFILPAPEQRRLPLLIERDRLFSALGDSDRSTYFAENLVEPGTPSELDTGLVVPQDGRDEGSASGTADAEKATWELVRNSNNPEDLRFFLEQFPDSPYAVPIRLRLRQLERAQGE